MLYDKHGRLVNYIRLAVTDRCNLRCFYCMPEEGIEYVARKELLSYEEMLRLLKILAKLGIEKVRITGGEPFIRKGLKPFIQKVNQIEGIKAIHLTTNGTLNRKQVGDLKEIGIKSVNLSLDSLDRERFLKITRRDLLPEVLDTFHYLIEKGIPTKINSVVMAGKNIEDIIPLAELSKNNPVEVRFIEEMPFNGKGGNDSVAVWDYQKILAHLTKHYSTLEPLPSPLYSTSKMYSIPGYVGKVGIIAAYSRTFCGSCNRIRLTPKGVLKTCLYDGGIFNIKDFMRAGATDQQIEFLIKDALAHKAKNGFEAEQQRMIHNPIQESMSSIGG